MGHSGFHHLRPDRDPGSPQPLQREARVISKSLKGAEMHVADMHIYRRKEEEQNMSSEGVLPKPAVDEGR